jgi:hypothetical protein
MGWTTIDTCKACGSKQENWYGDGFIGYIEHCSTCGAQTWLHYGETVGPCVKCGGEVMPGGEPACQMCGGREWIKPKGRDNYSSILD